VDVDQLNGRGVHSQAGVSQRGANVVETGGDNLQAVNYKSLSFWANSSQFNYYSKGRSRAYPISFSNRFPSFWVWQRIAGNSALEGAILQPTGAINGPRSLVLAPSLIGVSWGIREEELGYFAKSNELLKRMTLVFLHV
jgi:hypothetical protein